MSRTLARIWSEPLLLGTGLSRMLDEFSRDFGHVGFDIAPSFGRTDVYEQNHNLIFEAELPGMKKEDIAIKVEDDQLCISGEMKRDEKVGEENYFRMGRRYGRFQRSFPLPANVIDRDRITAGFEDGILKVSVPLKESLKEREKAIEVKVK